ncbi:MAG: aminoacyl-tRNA hydrolase [Burkholderiaceae bacterium]|nr:MAG: aminoacyl-tRNA hydrolase [Burkholderiaceae bacterium]TAM05192.1 MAG: aminoacyl-tRNA hydrolase [Pusillimonas sp.]
MIGAAPRRHAARVPLQESEMEFSAVRSQGAGGQNVNKVSSAIHLRFSIPASSLPETIKARLLALRDQRISADGVVVIKAQRSRSQPQNRIDAIARLQALVDGAATPPKRRRPTRPTLGSQLRRLESKAAKGRVKQLRGRVGRGD